MNNKFINTLSDTTKLSLITVILLILCLFGFYSHWPLAHDQAAFHYIGWAIDKDMLPYKDLITMNWPGSISLFYIAEHFFSNPLLAMKIIDITFLFILCLSSTIYLQFFNVRFSLKLLCIFCLIISYFSFGWITIMGRDHFSFILLFASTLPWAIKKNYYLLFLLGGIIAGQGFMIKPSPSIFTVFGIILFFELVKNKTINKEAILRTITYGAGGIIVLGAYIIILQQSECLHDFIRWGVKHNTTAYTQSAYESTSLVLLASLATYLSNNIATFILLASTFIYMQATTYKNFSFGKLYPHLFCLVIIVPSITSYIMQGKGYDYHLLPFIYSLIITGILLIDISLLHITKKNLTRFTISTLIIATIIYCFYIPFKVNPEIRSILRREYISNYLNTKVHADNEVLYLGYMPNILYDLKLKSPSPLLDTLCYFFFTPSNHPEYQFLSQELISALNNKTVKYLVVEHSNLNYLPTSVNNLINENYNKIDYSNYYFFNKDSYLIRHKRYGKNHHSLYVKKR